MKSERTENDQQCLSKSDVIKEVVFTYDQANPHKPLRLLWKLRGSHDIYKQRLFKWGAFDNQIQDHGRALDRKFKRPVWKNTNFGGGGGCLQGRGMISFKLIGTLPFKWNLVGKRTIFGLWKMKFYFLVILVFSHINIILKFVWMWLEVGGEIMSFLALNWLP